MCAKGQRCLQQIPNLASSELAAVNSSGRGVAVSCVALARTFTLFNVFQESILSRNNMNKLNFTAITIAIALAFSTAAMAEGMAKARFIK